MQLETINLKSTNLIPSDTKGDGMRIRQSGIAKVLWRKLDIDITESQIIVGGVDIFKDYDTIIGMDVIDKGDFAITHRADKTKFSFQIPSAADIDFTKE